MGKQSWSRSQEGHGRPSAWRLLQAAVSWGLTEWGLGAVGLVVLPAAATCGACPWPDGADLLPVRDASALPLLETGVPAARAAPLLGASAKLLLAAAVCAAPTLGARLVAAALAV
jgi:hypothetical protein